MKLDISKFKKLRTEKDHTILQHPDGHEIRVLHKPLSPDVRQQLHQLPEQGKKMSMGGEAIKKEKYAEGGLADSVSHFVKKATGQEAPTPPTEEQTREQQYAKIREQNTKNMNQGYADGGSVPKVDANKGKQISDSFKGTFAKGGGVHLHFYADGAGVSSADQSPADAYVKGLEQNQPVQDTAQPMPAENAVQSAPVQEEAPIAPIDSNVPPTGTLPEQAVSNVEAQNKAEMSGAQNVQQAQGKEADIYGKQAKQMQDLSAKYEQIGQDLHKKFQDVSDQVATAKIDPSHWWNQKSTGSKILTAVGMLFAGAGAGVSGHPEMASQAIDAAVNRDIDAQKQNINNKNTLLGKYMEMYNNLPQAEAATRLTMEAGVEGQIKQQAAKLGSQNAMLAAQQTIAARRQALLPQMEGLAKGQVMGQMYNDMAKPSAAPSGEEQAYQQQMQHMRVLNPDLGKDMENKYLPSVGVSRVPVPEKVRDKLIAGKDVSQQLAQLENFARENQGSLSPEVIKRGKVLAANASSAIRTAQDQGVFKKADQEFLESMVDPDPTKFFANMRTIPKYNQLRKLNDQSMSQLYKGYGIKPFGESSGSSDQVQSMNGVQYRKVPGGWEKVK